MPDLGQTAARIFDIAPLSCIDFGKFAATEGSVDDSTLYIYK